MPVKPERYYTLSAYVRSNIASSENAFLALECINDKREVIAREWGAVNAGPSWELKETHLSELDIIGLAPPFVGYSHFFR